MASRKAQPTDNYLWQGPSRRATQEGEGGGLLLPVYYLSVHPPAVYLSVQIDAYFCPSVCPCVYPPICLHTWYVYIHLPAYLPLSVCLSVYLLVWILRLYLSESIHLSIPSICPSIHQSFLSVLIFPLTGLSFRNICTGNGGGQVATTAICGGDMIILSPPPPPPSPKLPLTPTPPTPFSANVVSGGVVNIGAGCCCCCCACCCCCR